MIELSTPFYHQSINGSLDTTIGSCGLSEQAIQAQLEKLRASLAKLQSGLCR